MIPVSISIQGIGRYNNETVEFLKEDGSVRSIFITGKTGDGKSTMFEAMTIALFGRCRASSIDSLINRTVGKADVEFVFLEKGQRYKATYSKKVSDKSATRRLYVEIDGLWENITTKGRNKIEDIIGMDFEVFTTTRISRQKEQSKFAQLPPAERRKILASLLGLDKYSEMSDIAKQKVSELKSELDVVSAGMADSLELDRVLGEANALLKEKEGEKTKLEAPLKAYGDILVQYGAMAQLKSGIAQSAQVIESKKSAVENADAILSAKTSLEIVIKKKSEIKALHSTALALMNSYEQIKPVYARLLSDRTRFIDETNQNINAYTSQINAFPKFEKTTTALFDKLVKEQGGIAEVIQFTEKTLAEWESKKVSLAAEINASHGEIRSYGDISDLQVQINEINGSAPQGAKKVFEKALKEHGDVQGAINKVTSDLSANNQIKTSLLAKINVLQGGVKTHTDAIETLKGRQDSTCPTCFRPIDADAIKIAIASITKEIDAKKTDLTEQETALNAVEVDIAQCEQALIFAKGKVLELRMVDVQEKQSQLEAKEKGMGEINENIELQEILVEVGRFRTIEATVQELHAKLPVEIANFDVRIKEIETSFAKIIADMEALVNSPEHAKYPAPIKDLKSDNLDLQLHNIFLVYFPFIVEIGNNLIREERGIQDSVRPFIGEADLLEAANGIEATATEIKQLEATQVEKEKTLVEARKVVHEILLKAHEQGVVISKEDLMPDAMQALRDNTDTTMRAICSDIGALQQTIKQCEASKSANAEAREKIDVLNREISQYSQLVELLGRNGIQKDIIADVKSHIEMKANEILNQFTDGRFSLEIVLTREAKTAKGSQQEVVDIIIHDEHDDGVTRPYEALSGGESFQVDLALRLAFFYLKVDTEGNIVLLDNDSAKDNFDFIAIDEGFGALDQDGTLDAVVETLEQIKNQYGQIIVISHIKEMARAFDLVLQVAVGSDGFSTITPISSTEILDS